MSYHCILVIYIGIHYHQVAGGQQEQGEGDRGGVEQGGRDLCIIQLGDDKAGVPGGEEAGEGVPPVPKHPGKGVALYLWRVATPLHVGVQLAGDGEGGGALCLMDILHVYLLIITLWGWEI